MAKNNKNINKEDFYERMRVLGGKTNNEESTKTSTLLFHKKAGDNRTYAIVKENSKFFIKTSTSKKTNLDESDFAYVNGVQNLTDNRYNSFADALKNLNFKIISINEALGLDGDIISESWINESHSTEIEEEVKKLKEDEKDEEDPNAVAPEAEPVAQEAPAPEATEVPAQTPAPEEAPIDDTNTDNTGATEETPETSPEETPSTDTEENPEGEDANKEIESTLGKLTQKLSATEISPKMTKSIMNSIISTLDLKSLDDNERIKMAKRIKMGGAKLEEDFEDDDLDLSDKSATMTEPSEFQEFMHNNNIEESDPEDVAYAIINWATEFAMGENNGDFAGVAACLNSDIWSKIKDEVSPKFIQGLKSKLKGKNIEAPTQMGESVTKGSKPDQSTFVEKPKTTNTDNKLTKSSVMSKGTSDKSTFVEKPKTSTDKEIKSANIAKGTADKSTFIDKPKEISGDKLTKSSVMSKGTADKSTFVEKPKTTNTDNKLTKSSVMSKGTPDKSTFVEKPKTTKTLVDEDFDISDTDENVDDNMDLPSSEIPAATDSTIAPEGSIDSPAIDNITATTAGGTGKKDVQIDLKNQTINVQMSESKAEQTMRKVIKKLIESEIKDEKIVNKTAKSMEDLQKIIKARLIEKLNRNK